MEASTLDSFLLLLAFIGTWWLNRIYKSERDKARRLHKLMEGEAMFHLNNTVYYQGLLDECAKHLGDEVYICDSGDRVTEPLRAKVPELVAKMAREHKGVAEHYQTGGIIGRTCDGSALLSEIGGFRNLH